MSRLVSLVVLVIFLAAIGVLFYQVIARFILPLFLATVLAVMFAPLYQRATLWFRGHCRIAAAATTAAILLIVLVPLFLIFLQAGREAVAIYQHVSNGETGAGRPPEPKEIQADLADDVVATAARFGLQLTREGVQNAVREKMETWVTPVMKVTAQFTISLLIGLLVTIVSLYYFLADGPAIRDAIKRLSPLADHYEDELMAEFERVCRAVVAATLLSAVAQGLLAGIGFVVVGVPLAFLLTVITIVFAMIPFFGAVAVWVPVCLWLFFYADRPLAAILLAVYCAAIVSTIDNVIKPMVLHGRSNIHPLLALLSVLGGVQALGPLGIFVGPMVAAFLVALLKMLQLEITRLGARKTPQTPAPMSG